MNTTELQDLEIGTQVIIETAWSGRGTYTVMSVNEYGSEYTRITLQPVNSTNPLDAVTFTEGNSVEVELA